MVLDPLVDSTPPPLYGSAREGRDTEADAEADADADAEADADARTEADAGAEAAQDPDDRVWLEDGSSMAMDEGEVDALPQDVEVSEGDGSAIRGTARKRGRAARVEKDRWGYEVHVLIHETDVHQLGVAFCKCSAGRHIPHDQQLLQFGGIYPATKEKPRTGFTLNGLAFMEVDRLTCHSTPDAMYRRLRRHTSLLHPDAVPNCYPETLRVQREYAVTNKLTIPETETSASQESETSSKATQHFGFDETITNSEQKRAL
ncbi:unnamed protein product [Peniophora sp. CBMAI 1063]|nr:unnamed protein product [Peniophora sp. CBMAI 1063]